MLSNKELKYIFGDAVLNNLDTNEPYTLIKPIGNHYIISDRKHLKVLGIYRSMVKTYRLITSDYNNPNSTYLYNYSNSFNSMMKKYIPEIVKGSLDYNPYVEMCIIIYETITNSLRYLWQKLE